MSGGLFDPDAIVRAVRAAANLRPRCDNRDFATNPAECRNVANVATPFDADDEAAIEERAGLAADRVPALYLDAWARLNCQKPISVSEADWRLALDDGGRFLNSWGADAATMQWTAGELFDVPRDGRPGGVVWRLKSKRVTALSEHRARFNDGRTLRRGGLEDDTH